MTGRDGNGKNKYGNELCTACRPYQESAGWERLVRAGEIIGIPVLDHIIVGDEKEYFSFRNEKLVLGEQEASVSHAAETKQMQKTGKMR